MLRVIYTLKMALGWTCWHIWNLNPEWIQNVYWLNDLLLPWVGFYAYDMGYEYYRSVMK